MKKLIAFSYIGGKYSHLDFLLPNFPKEKVFVDVFGGSASVCLNVEGYKHIVYNDINEEIYNFFKVLRESHDVLIEKLKLTPYSRKEYKETRHGLSLEDVEKARQFFVKVNMGISRNGLSTSGFSTECNFKSGSRAITFKNKVDNLYLVAEKLRSIGFESLHWKDLIDKFDKEGIFLYLDPPYSNSARQKVLYEKEFSDQDHMDLITRLYSCKAKWALSGYRCDFYDKMLKDFKRIDGPIKTINSSRGKKMNRKRESLWVNY